MTRGKLTPLAGLFLAIASSCLSAQFRITIREGDADVVYYGKVTRIGEQAIVECSDGRRFVCRVSHVVREEPVPKPGKTGSKGTPAGSGTRATPGRTGPVPGRSSSSGVPADPSDRAAPSPTDRRVSELRARLKSLSDAFWRDLELFGSAVTLADAERIVAGLKRNQRETEDAATELLRRLDVPAQLRAEAAAGSKNVKDALDEALKTAQDHFTPPTLAKRCYVGRHEGNNWGIYADIRIENACKRKVRIRYRISVSFESYDGGGSTSKEYTCVLKSQEFVDTKGLTMASCPGIIVERVWDERNLRYQPRQVYTPRPTVTTFDAAIIEWTRIP